MKLSEVIKAIEDGSESEFRNNIDNIKINKSTFEGRIKFWFADKSLYIEDWEEVKPPRQWSEKELMLFKLLPDWAKWIATDKGSDDVFVFENKPEIENIIFFQNETDKHDYKLLEKEIFDFLTITFEESPVYIGDMKGE